MSSFSRQRGCADAVHRLGVAGHRDRSSRWQAPSNSSASTRPRRTTTAMPERRFITVLRGWQSSTRRSWQSWRADLPGAAEGGVRGWARRGTAGTALGRTEPPAAVPAVERTAADRQRARGGRRRARQAARCGDARDCRPGHGVKGCASGPLRVPRSVCLQLIPGPLRRLIATLPALEVPRPDWPAEAVVVGPLHFEPTTSRLDIPRGHRPGRARRTIHRDNGCPRPGRVGVGDPDTGGVPARRIAGRGLTAERTRLHRCRPGRWSDSVARTNCFRTPTW